jgi:hypothetical protein
MSKHDAYFQTLKPYFTNVFADHPTPAFAIQGSIVTVPAALRISYQHRSAPPTPDFTRATSNTTLHQSAVKSQLYPTVVFTNHFHQVHLRQLTIWIVKLIVIILRETGTQLTENNVHLLQTSSCRVHMDNNHYQFKQKKVSAKCTPKRISTQRLLNLFVRPLACRNACSNLRTDTYGGTLFTTW